MSFKNQKHSKIQQMTLIGLMTAVICILAPFSLFLPFSPVPFSLGTLAIYLVSMILNRKSAFISVFLYLLLGFAGLPVFTGFTGGVGKLLGPTGGYLIGYLFIALIGGHFADKWSNHIPLNLCGMLLGTVICYAFGTLWLSIQSELNWKTALSVATLPFIPGDLVKIIIAAAIGYQIRKRLKKAALL